MNSANTFTLKYGQFVNVKHKDLKSPVGIIWDSHELRINSLSNITNDLVLESIYDLKNYKYLFLKTPNHKLNYQFEIFVSENKIFLKEMNTGFDVYPFEWKIDDVQ